MIEKGRAWLSIARAECETLLQYLQIGEEGGLMDNPQKAEINGDEFNHALIALLNAAIELGVSIPTDGLDELFDRAFPEMSGDADEGDEQ